MQQTAQQQKNYRYFGTIRRLLRRGAEPSIRKILDRIHPADIAQIFSYFPADDQLTLLKIIVENERRADIICELPVERATEVIEKMPISLAADIICEMSGDDQADLLGQLDEGLSAKILEAMPEQESDDVQDLLRYDERSAGGIMNPDVLAVHLDSTIEEALQAVQKSDDVDSVFYIYVVDEHNSLSGVLSLRRLVTSKPNTLIKNIMNPNVVSVHTEEDQEDVARLVGRYDFLAIPVVDETNTLVGAVTVDDIIDVLAEEATEDMLKMAGAGDENLHDASTFKQIAKRVPWLFAALGGGVLASLVIKEFQQTLARFLPMAAFIPVIAGMAGNVGSQSLAIVIRGLATRQIKIRQAWTTIRTQIVVGTILGVIYGTVLGVVGIWQFTDATTHAGQLAMAVGTATMATMILAAGLATTIPLMFARINIDPAVATGPFVTTAIDVMGVFIYFTVVNLLVPS